MKLQFLGTAAAEGIPAIFCECNVCKTARARGGKEIRTRSQSIINRDLLIDLSADSYMHSIVNNIDFTPICHCIITHTHSDHLYPAELQNRINGFSNTRKEIHTLNLYGTKSVLDIIKATSFYKNLISDKAIEFHLIKPYNPFKILDYTVTAYEAAHDPKSDPVFYSVEQNGKCILHANDTGIFKESVWNYLKKNKQHFDLVSFDCTGGNMEITYTDVHLDVKTARQMRDKLIKIGAADGDTVFVLNHFTHNSSFVLYKEMCELLKDEFVISYDGLTLDI